MRRKSNERPTTDQNRKEGEEGTLGVGEGGKREEQTGKGETEQGREDVEGGIIRQ